MLGGFFVAQVSFADSYPQLHYSHRSEISAVPVLVIEANSQHFQAVVGRQISSHGFGASYPRSQNNDHAYKGFLG